MRKRAMRCYAILAAAACVFGVVIAGPPTAPVANADNLGNGYSVTCTPNGNDAVCNISGCPRVSEDLAGDVVHVRTPRSQQDEIGKSCNNTATVTVRDATNGFTMSVQGCRKEPSVVHDKCGAWSDYSYTPPAPKAAAAPVPNDQKPVVCTGGPDAGKTLPPGSSCAVAPAAVQCPAGSASSTVPAGQQCAAPTDAVSINITQSGFVNAHAAVTNKSSLPAHCSYTAKLTHGFGPPEVDRTVDVAANSTGTITDMLWPPLGDSYHAVVTCMATYNGKQTSIGSASQDVSG